MKYTNHHKTGERIEATDDMIKLRNSLVEPLGFVFRKECTLRRCFPDKKKHAEFVCIETEAIDYESNGVMISPSHVVAVFVQDGHEYYRWPDEVMKAAHSIDKSKPKKVKAGAKSGAPSLFDKP